MSDAELNETTLRRERLIPLPPEILFALWTEPAQLLRWWAPDGYEPRLSFSKPGPAAAGVPPCAGPTAACWQRAASTAWLSRRGMVYEEKGIEYVLTERMLRAPEVLAIHPFGKMPVLRHGDFVLCESKAIATYLDRSFPGPPLIPSDPRLAALTEQWVSLVNTVMDRTLIRTYILAYIASKTSDGKPDRAAIEAVMPAVREQLGILDRAVASTGYLVGDQFTFADVNLLPILHRVGQFPEGAAALTAAIYLAAYYDTHAARPSFVRTDPPPGPPRSAKPS